MPHKNGWTVTQNERLTKLWNQTDPVLSAGAIGREMGVSKNAIVGLAHRLNLPSRPSPILPSLGGVPAAPRPKRMAANTLQPLTFEAPQVESESALALPAHVPNAVIDIGRARQAEAAHKPYVVPASASKPCQWPVGDPRAPDFHFCGAAGLAGKPYCAAHHKIAHLPAYKWCDDAT